MFDLTLDVYIISRDRLTGYSPPVGRLICPEKHVSWLNKWNPIQNSQLLGGTDAAASVTIAAYN